MSLGQTATKNKIYFSFIYLRRIGSTIHMVHARSKATFDNNHARIHEQRIEPEYVIAVWSRKIHKKREMFIERRRTEKNKIVCFAELSASLAPNFVVVRNGSDNRSKRSDNMLELPVSPTDNNLRIKMAEREKCRKEKQNRKNTHWRRRRSVRTVNVAFFSFLKAQNHYLIRIGCV